MPKQNSGFWNLFFRDNNANFKIKFYKQGTFMKYFAAFEFINSMVLMISVWLVKYYTLCTF